MNWGDHFVRIAGGSEEVGKWGSGEVGCGVWGSGEIELKPQNPITLSPVS